MKKIFLISALGIFLNISNSNGQQDRIHSGSLPLFNVNHSVVSDKTSSKGIKGTLYQNGSFITLIGGGYHGLDFSLIDMSIGLSSYGYAHSIGSGYAVAEDFAVPDGGWLVDSLIFYCYQTGSDTISTITDYRVLIWNGVPDEAGSNIVWGDLTTNRLGSTSFAHVYRGVNTTDTTRPVMRNVIVTNGLSLPKGNYWIEWQAGGIETSGPWVVPVTISHMNITGNAKIYNGSDWSAINDNGYPQGLPFEIYGTGTSSCIHPVYPVVSAISDHAATVSWSSISGITEWSMEYGPTGFIPGTGTIINHISTNVVNLSNLLPSTMYDVYIYTNCSSDVESTPAFITFSTSSCPSQFQCGYVLEFTDNFGDGWNGASIRLYSNGILTGTYTLENGSYDTDTIMLCPNDSISLIFNGSTHDDECGFTFYNPFDSILCYFNEGYAPSSETVIYTGYASCVEHVCIPPTTMSTINQTPSSIQLIWTPGSVETEWQIEYGISGFSLGNGTRITTTYDPFTLTGLLQGVTYDWYIRAICQPSDTSNWTSLPSHFTLPCAALLSYPFIESFEGNLFQPLCWFNVDADNDGFKWQQQTVAQGYSAYNGTNVAVSLSHTENTTLTPNNYLISPPMWINSSNLWLQCYVSPINPLYPTEVFSIEISTSDSSISSFTSIFSDTLTDSDSAWKEILLPLNAYYGQTIYIAFRHYNSTGMSGIKLDNVEIAEGLHAESINTTENIIVYPNPATDQLFIVGAQVLHVELYNLLEQKITSYSKTNTIFIGNIAQGTYLVKIITNKGAITRKITIVR